MQSSNGEKWFIGIDGGGSKTRAAICNEAGQVRAIVVGESSNPLSRSWGDVEATLRELIDAVRIKAGAKKEEVASLFIGLGGADRPQIKERIQHAFADEWGERLLIDNDVIAALYAGTWGQPGVVLLAGTGSIACAFSKEGARHRVGGWGYLVGDEGSGFDLGKKAAIAVMREYDGRGESTVLTRLFMDHYGVERPDELISLIYGGSNPRKELAKTSQLVEQAATLGDPVANALIKQAVEDLLELADACLKKVQEPVPVVLAGGLLTASTILREQLVARASFQTVIPIVSPVVGALVAAVTQLGLAVDEKMAEQLRVSAEVLEKSHI
ncbi:N-acetylglucosamine kinase [Brevibacillus brevis]|uniref:N-acetylglucosamine kinase n=1 Tax=Brevibacillus brevis TaxID=1393 RepID=UPI000D0F4996|nr:BadF/BadG/BcrA/BcrD ATPase family protein [Brevibacillus brevis]PSJ69366.1 N-acetylglucosamine kinase [Brevibacillus brevis]RED28178.1 N-acetylglucosamine kinase-like BadF-type ATPase [Brevibacillus brevis]GEC92949.1 N-acetylmuramic acid/N-acetylglucosamine kinase [Brevibacillus brevis]VEF90874.1 BadF/BadG/BcrA/BcrD ATPase family [Brevibacillus brevis]